MAKKKKKQRRSLQNDKTYSMLRECKGVMLGFENLETFGAHSMGIGRKIVKGKATNSLAIRFYVAKKRASRTLSSEEEVPKTIRFFSRKAKGQKNLPTDIIETPPAQFEQVDPETRIRPVPGGVSGGTSSSTGTIGGWVWDTTDDTIVMLSNDHVFGHTAGVDILQQGVADGGSLPADKIGDVKRGIARSYTVPNIVDCAIGDPDSSAIYDLRVLEIGPAVYEIDVGVGDMLVEKYGQTTRHTYGEITDADWDGTVSGRPFEDCLRVDARAPSADWSAGGDSGSLVFSRTPISAESDIKPVVGLHFAGASTYGVECKIQNVFNRLNLTTLCAGAFSAFLDSLFEAETEGEVGEEAEVRLRTLSAMATRSAVRVGPPVFVRKDRSHHRARNFYAGISRDIQKRLTTSKRGQVVTNFADRHRAELLTMITKDGDIRRATVAALRPLVAGATTTTDVLERAITATDLRRLDRLTREVARRSSGKLRTTLKMVRALTQKAEGKTLASILQIKL